MTSIKDKSSYITWMPVTYKAQNGHPRDVRTFIFDRSHILEYMVRKYKLKGKTDDDTMHNCCIFVQDHIRYVSDSDTHSQNEFWQNPEDTLARGTGDCEDGAILMKSLSLIAGVPDWKCKIVAGMVRGGGHAYCTYIQGNRQVIMDWCYWPTRHRPENKKALGEDTRYKEVWFSFNHDHCYSGRSVVYSKGKVAMDAMAMPKLHAQKPDWME
jgi:hypothetical protein